MLKERFKNEPLISKFWVCDLRDDQLSIIKDLFNKAPRTGLELFLVASGNIPGDVIDNCLQLNKVVTKTLESMGYKVIPNNERSIKDLLVEDILPAFPEIMSFEREDNGNFYYYNTNHSLYPSLLQSEMHRGFGFLLNQNPKTPQYL